MWNVRDKTYETQNKGTIKRPNKTQTPDYSEQAAGPAGRTGGGGWGARGAGQCGRHGSAESPYYTPEPDTALCAMYTGILKN